MATMIHKKSESKAIARALHRRLVLDSQKPSSRLFIIWKNSAKRTAGIRKLTFQPKIGLLKYLIGLPNRKKAPEIRFDAKAHHNHGINLFVISVIFWLGTARPRMRRSRRTTLPITTAMPRMCTV